MGIALQSSSPEGRKSSYKGAAQVEDWLAHHTMQIYMYCTGFDWSRHTNSTDKLCFLNVSLCTYRIIDYPEN